jgi:hypothetical protein
MFVRIDIKNIFTFDKAYSIQKNNHPVVNGSQGFVQVRGAREPANAGLQMCFTNWRKITHQILISNNAQGVLQQVRK